MDATALPPSADAPAPRTGLRERSRAKRYALIQRTGMRLFAERGYAATTIADIAEAAEVAPRTVSGYFPSKIDIATSFADSIAGRLTAAMNAEPDGDLITILDTWLAQEEELADPELFALAEAMHEANPELKAISSAHVAEAGEYAGAALAAHAGLPEDHFMLTIYSAAIKAVLAAYIGSLRHAGQSREAHRKVMDFLQGIFDAAAKG
ncbi:TetR/AcrR family transcriptional regulator [Actinacidiphila acididurans]|uniref:TetR/AcrR family transcriptional regulator n=1 Tax=Actinacidiphila acididurans TaxID=2784346 RepID=A0ABS2TUX8_9ACTN|nr:TetR/AcrR family transcriptional regulator [Actinacidiphila acididurans]MBM9506791.1 TetR/AcrR family transcriptional regulator [Actinacidiphila acididurans]